MVCRPSGSALSIAVTQGGFQEYWCLDLPLVVLTGQGGTLLVVKTAHVILKWDWAHQHWLSSTSSCRVGWKCFNRWLSTTPELLPRGEFCRLFWEIRVAIKSQLCFSTPCLFLQFREKSGLSFLINGTVLHFSGSFCSFCLVTREEHLRASD